MSNFAFWLWIGLSAGLVLLFIYAALTNRRRRMPPDMDEIVPFLRRVDLDVFSSLLDPREDEYMRSTCGKVEYSRFRQKQIRIATESLRRMSHNAGLLQSLGHSRLESANQLVAAQARELVDAGVNVRLYSIMGIATLYLWRIFGSSMRFGSSPLCTANVNKLISSSMIPAYEVFKIRAIELTAMRDTGLREMLRGSL